MVVIFALAAALTGMTQERTAAPLTCTVHAPHCATPQPYFVPVRPTCSRITHSSGVFGSTSTSCVLPLIVKRTIALLLPVDLMRGELLYSRGKSGGNSHSAKRELCRVAALRDDQEKRNEDQTDGIKPIIVCAHAGILAPAQRGSISAAGRSIADEIDEAGQVLPQLSADRLVGKLAGGVEHVPGARNLHPAAEPGSGAERPQHRHPGVLRQDVSETAR